MFFYIEGPLGSGKTEKLIEIAKTLVDDNASASMLVLCSNHARQKYFLDALLNQLDSPLGALPVYTFSGYVRNTLFNYWPLVETTIGKVIRTGPACLTPQLSGMEDSELILNQIYEWLMSRNPQLFAEFPGTSRSLMKQIIRRLRLRAENLLPRDEMTRRSTELQEICIDDMAAIEKWFDRISYTLRVLDPNKQMEVFHQLLQQAPLLQDDLRQQVKHLLVDDVDETIPAQQSFIRWLSPSLKSLVLTADLDGGSRRGYLNAYPYDWQLLKSLRPGETISLHRKDRVYQDAQVLLNNWKLPEEAYPFHRLGSSLTLAPTCMTQVEMMDLLLEDISHQLEKGYSPGDMTLVLPEANPLFFYRIQNKLQQRGIRVQLLSGTKRPLDHPLCRGMIYLLQLANQGAWESPLSPIELRTIFTHILQFDVWSQLGMEALLQAIFIHQSKGVYLLENPLPEPESLMISLPESLTLPPELFQRYCLLYDWLSTASQKPFETQILSAFQKIIAPFCGNETQRFLELNQWLESYTRQKWIHKTIQAEGLLQTDRAGAASSEQKGSGTFAQRWIALVKSGSVADSPEIPEAIDETAILLASPQKIIDFEVSRKIQYWVDISSREWARSDNAPLYNAWVHSAVWDGSQSAFSEEFKEALIRTRAAHITRTLYLLAQEQVRAFSSELDHEGFNQTGLLQTRLLAQSGETVLDNIPEAPIILRPEQEPVMAYTEGSMAITAVPGAGKTFINVELILKLIDSGVDPTEILVLTYMDSAAKTLLSRIKNKMAKRRYAFPSHRLPTVSTIHSLAFRILTENDNSLTMGFLPEDVEILDEFKKEELLASVAFDTEAQACNLFGQQMGNDWLQIVKKALFS
ncbi:MAG: UvrD-helicase domain-containing protein [Cyanobacteria bacterium]|nr:UvrD-helicase domain-containing protein [Cyanobacteriota bacterium]